MGNGRKSAKFKSTAVLGLLRGESAEELSRKYGITMAELSAWRDEFIEKKATSDSHASNPILVEKVIRLKGRPPAANGCTFQTVVIAQCHREAYTEDTVAPASFQNRLTRARTCCRALGGRHH